MPNSDPVTHDELIAQNRRTSMVMLVSEFVLIGTLGGLIGLLITRSVGAGIIVGAAVAIAVDVIGWLLAVRATIRLTRAVEVDATQAPVLHNVIEGLCIATGLPKPKVYIVDDPAPNAFAFGRSPERAGVAVTSGLLNLMSRRELEGVLAHELSHIRNRDVQVTTLAVTTVGILVVVADISARASFFSDWGDDDGGGAALLAVALVAGVLAFGAKLLSFAISRHREELADTSAVAIISPGGLRRALEKLEADHTVVHHVSRATAHMWIESPLQNEGDEKHAKVNRMFDTHPPIAERIAVLRRLEGLDPEGRGPVDQTSTGVPVDLAKLGEAAARRRQPLLSMQAIQPGDTMVAPVGKPPGWYHVDEQTLRYWQGASWTMWFATWNGKRWVQTSRLDNEANR
ncbi:MAG TPA: M48 family metalloprotease [Acidimicrobiia bacterium]|nr:M48 family metalloprotease [Acidimicrobiia bacterium]